MGKEWRTPWWTPAVQEDRPQPGSPRRGYVEGPREVPAGAAHRPDARAEMDVVEILFPVRACNGALRLAAMPHNEGCAPRCEGIRGPTQRPPQRADCRAGLHGILAFKGCEECEDISEEGVMQPGYPVKLRPRQAHHNAEAKSGQD